LFALTSASFYNKYVHLPDPSDPTPPEIRNNTKLYPFFKDVLGALDGTHIPVCAPASEREGMRNRKGGLSQNVLGVCSFDLRYLYLLTGWEGSAGDGQVYHHARLRDFFVPPGKFYLADGGFGNCATLLVPYRGKRYHLAEWGRAAVR
jgi:hypothetical protein